MALRVIENVAFLVAAIAILAFGNMLSAQESRIKDIANIRGVRTNQLIGFGLVIGLNQTGDTANSLATNEAAAKMLTRLGVTVDTSNINSQNIAAVIVTAELPAFARIGDRVDAKVSTVGDSTSLAGGTLVMTPLRAGDSQIYAVAQGTIVTGQADGVLNRVLTVARIPNGVVVEREFEPDFSKDGFITLSLRNSDFSTNSHVTDRINSHFKGFFAKSLDPVTIEVEIPPFYENEVVAFVSEMENLRVQVERKAKVVLNERTGTVVLGADVTIGKVAVAHGNLTVQINSEDQQSQSASVAAVSGSTVGDLIEALNALGMRPSDLVGVIQAIHAAGALQADLEVM